MVPEARIEKDRVTDIYSKIAPAYNLWAWLTESKARDRCLELAAIQNGEDVLEVAVGTGLAFERILAANPTGRNEGIDLTEAMLVRAEKKAAKSGSSNYRLRVGDAYDLDFPDNSFDVLVNNYMFDLLPQQDFLTVLEEFKSVLLVPQLKACGFQQIDREYISQLTFPSEVIRAEKVFG